MPERRRHPDPERRQVADGDGGGHAQDVRAAGVEADGLDAEEPVRGRREGEGAELAADGEAGAGRERGEGLRGPRAERVRALEGRRDGLLRLQAVVLEDVGVCADAVGACVVLGIREVGEVRVALGVGPLWCEDVAAWGGECWPWCEE